MNQAELASDIGMDRTALSKIESGTRRVSALELVELARALRVRMEWFFADPPEAVAAYRTSSPDQVSSDVDVWLERLSREVTFVSGAAAPRWPRMTVTTDPDRMDPDALSRQVRHDAGIGDDPIRSMSAFAQALGIVLFSVDLGRNSPDGAGSPIDGFGIAVVNGERDVGRRRLTAAHEIGHLLCGDRYEVDWRVGEADRAEWESRLDRFARAVLLPEGPLRAGWATFGGDGFHERDQALRDASHWQVDMSTLAARLVALKLIDQAAARRIRSYKHGRADFDELNLVNRTDLVPTEVPRAYAKAVLKLYRAEEISADRALDLLLGTYDEADLPTLEPLAGESPWQLL